MSASGFKSEGCGDTVSVEVERRKDGVKKYGNWVELLVIKSLRIFLYWLIKDLPTAY